MSPTPPEVPAIDPRHLLDSMYRNEPQLGRDGQLHEMDRKTRVPPDLGELLLQLHAELKPERTVEIGLGYGFSTLFFMMAMQRSGSGHHVAIDPLQIDFHGIGATRVQLVQMQNRFTLIEKESAVGLPLLAAMGMNAQLIFIDGQHRFDNVMVDFFLADSICPAGRVIVFDDLWMRSVQKMV